ncbi:putative disease resistance protein At1g50180 [Triticum dicoccoides]|uniref:putative disease resistance protein At1g50180 isoform X1 n=1 Tax=Triticum aestivum TaxID=4565 RepID=UPI0018914AE3|nr:putative disease resistance protein At1g50180 [Triticum dicoccoides]XP_044425593.1 putative disease resistance protein At1g50180 isoform X1 [Triticum aestivum]
MAESAVSIVLGNVNALAVRETTMLCCVTLEVELLKDELKRLRGFLRDADNKWRRGDESTAVLVGQIREVAYDADNAIEAAEYMQKRNRLKKGFMGTISRYARLPSDLTNLHKVGVEIQRIKRKISDIFESANRLKIVDLGNTSTENLQVDGELPQEYGPMHQNFEDVVMVGFEDDYQEIVGKLLDKGDSLSVVSLVAMGGAGKTTLARKFYTSTSAKQHFEIVSWVTVSQKYKGIDLLKDILKQITGSTFRSADQMQEYEVAKMIHDFLSQKRYLVVLDDVWETDTWEILNRTTRAFPDAENGSRILITTRKEDVANHVQMPTHVHPLKKLDEQKSWELFSSKALPSYKRSVIHDVDEFEKLGRKLARKCGGLPLELAVLGGYLSKNLNAQTWSDILLDWPSTKNEQMMRNMLARSYWDLPNHYLRSCFLYIAAFPEDSMVYVSDLTQLWIAESFIPHIPNHTLEETAYKYVTELVERSLVHAVETSMGGGRIAIIRIHDILHDWCKEEARQDGFLDGVDKTTGRAGAQLSSANLASYRSTFQSLSNVILPGAPNVRTLFGFQLESVSLPRLRFLRVLYIEGSTLRDFSTVIGGCIHLRYLKLHCCGGVMLPSSIGQLLYLQTIDLRDTKLDSQVPQSLWEIPTLRHVYLTDGFSPPPPARSVRQQHKELQTLFWDVSDVGSECCYHDMEILLGQMGQLTTLFLVMSPMPSEVFNILAHMPHLVDISLSNFGVLDKLPAELPRGVKRLRLCAHVIKQDPMPILEKLHYLVVLDLSGYEGQTMFCSAQGFPRLQELKLVGFSTDDWRIEVGAMPKLSDLTLRECNRKLPEGFLHLPSLNHLMLYRMPQISEDDNTLKELERKGCQVHTYIA